MHFKRAKDYGQIMGCQKAIRNRNAFARAQRIIKAHINTEMLLFQAVVGQGDTARVLNRHTIIDIRPRIDLDRAAPAALFGFGADCLGKGHSAAANAHRCRRSAGSIQTSRGSTRFHRGIIGKVAANLALQ